MNEKEDVSTYGDTEDTTQNTRYPESSAPPPPPHRAPKRSRSFTPQQWDRRPSHDSQKLYEYRKNRDSELEKIRLRGMIIKIGDTYEKVASQLKGLAAEVEEVYRNETSKRDILTDTIVECVSKLPLKTSFYTTLMAFLHQRRPPVRDELAPLVNNIVTEAHTAFDVKLREQNIVAALPLLRFLLQLVDCKIVEWSDWYGIADSVVDTLELLREDKTEACDALIALILCALPWMSAATYQSHTDDINKCVARIEEVVTHRQRPNIEVFSLSILKPGTGTKPIAHTEYMLKAINQLKENNWQSKVILRSYLSKHLICDLTPKRPNTQTYKLTPLSISVDEILANSRLQRGPNLADLVFDDWIQSVSDVSQAGAMEDQNAESEPASLFDKFEVEESVLSIVENFRSDPEACVMQILKIPFLHISFERIVVQCLFSEMLKADRTEAETFLYVRLLQNIIKIQESCKAVVLSLIKHLLDRIEEWEELTFHKLTDFFGYWLSLPQASIIADLTHILSLEDGDTQPQLSTHKHRYVKAVLSKLTRLQTVEKEVTEALPPQLADCLITSNSDNTSCMPYEATPQTDVPFEYKVLKTLMKYSYPNEDEKAYQLQIISVFLEFMVGRPRLAREPEFLYGLAAKLSSRLNESNPEPSLKKQRQNHNVIKLTADESCPPSKEAEREMADVEEAMTDTETSTLELRMTDEDIKEHLLPMEFGDDLLWSKKDLFADVFVQAFLTLSNKSISHMQRIITYYGQCMQTALAGTHRFEEDADEAHDHSMCSAILQHLFGCWIHQPIRLVCAVDQILRTEVMAPLCVTHFITSAQCNLSSNDLLFWEVLHMCFTTFKDQLESVSQDCCEQNLSPELIKRNMTVKTLTINAMKLVISSLRLSESDSEEMTRSKERLFLFFCLNPRVTDGDVYDAAVEYIRMA